MNKLIVALIKFLLVLNVSTDSCAVLDFVRMESASDVRLMSSVIVDRLK